MLSLTSATALIASYPLKYYHRLRPHTVESVMSSTHSNCEICDGSVIVFIYKPLWKQMWYLFALARTTAACTPEFMRRQHKRTSERRQSITNERCFWEGAYSGSCWFFWWFWRRRFHDMPQKSSRTWSKIQTYNKVPTFPFMEIRGERLRGE